MTHTISPVAGPAPAVDSSPKVDIGIVTIRDDEFRAVLARFPDKIGILKGARRTYMLCHADAGGGERYRVAMLRLIEQGQGEAQDAARDLIEDLGPRLVLVVGIASGRPSDDVTLGDVVVSTRVHDFTVEARKVGKTPTYDVAGGPIDKALAVLVANLAAREDELGDWTAGLPAWPPVSWTKKGDLYGPADWRREVREKLAHHHDPEAAPRAPRYVAGPIASSDRLLKDPDLLKAWLQAARSLLAIEMESGGLYRAARERCPMLAIRGISDIVGLKRADTWTKYACASAAAFTRAFLCTRPIELASVASGTVETPHATSKTNQAPAAAELVDFVTQGLNVGSSSESIGDPRVLLPEMPGLSMTARGGAQAVVLKSNFFGNLVSLLRLGNARRIDEYVGEKYLKELYITRRAERDIVEFLRDREELINIAIGELQELLDSDRSVLKSVEVRVIRQTIESLRNSKSHDDDKIVTRLSEQLMPLGYEEIAASLENYCTYVSNEATSMKLQRLDEFHEHLEKLLKEASAPQSLKEKLSDLRNVTVQRKPKDGTGRYVINARSIDPGMDGARKQLDIMRRFDRFRREFITWGSSRIIGKRQDGVGIKARELIDRCRWAVNAAHKRCLFIVDAAGSGKTNLLCDMALRTEWPWPTIVLFVKGFGSTSPITLHALDEVAIEIGYPNFNSLANACNRALEEQRRYMVILIDGINEYSNDAELATDLNVLMSSYQETRVRFVVSCRDIYWKHFQQTLSNNHSAIIHGQLKGYSDDELIQALAGYLEAYGLRTRIEGDALERFRSPILLRFFCEAYGVRGSTDSTRGPLRVRWINLKRLFDDYRARKFGQSVEISQRKREYRGHVHYKAELDQAVFRLALEMRRLGSSILTTESTRELINASHPDSRMSAFQLLLDEDVIIEERNGMIYFVYEAFMEYVIARSLLDNTHDELAAWQCLSHMVEDAHRFSNMRGVVLMALVMLVEERGIAAFGSVLDRGSEWRDVVLSAISQLDRPHIDLAMSVLTRLAQQSETSERREAFRILLVNAGSLGRRAIVRLVLSGGTAARVDVMTVVRGRGDAELIAELMQEAAAGADMSVIEPVLLAMVPSRRALDHLSYWIQSGISEMAILGLRVIANAPPGEYKRAIEIARQASMSTFRRVRDQAARCLSLVQERAVEGERNRRRQISRARRRQVGVKRRGGSASLGS